MKNKLSIVLISVLMLSLAACGANNTDTANADPQAQAGQDTNGWQNGNGSGNGGYGGYGGQMQGQRADLMGEVSSISGNKVTLKVVQMPSFNRNGAPPQGGTGKGGSNSQAAANNSSAANSAPSDNSAAAENSGSSNKAQPSGGGNSGSQKNGQRQQRATQYTGETKTITIPDGITITSMGRRSSDNSQQTLTLSDIKEGNILQIWYSDKDKQTISKIGIMQSMPGFGGGNPANQTAGSTGSGT